MDVKHLYKTFGGDVLVPLYNFEKYPKINGWQDKTFKLKDFKRATGVGLRINKIKDIVCFDIDIKEKNFDKETIEMVKNEIFKMIKKGIYIEETQNKAYHLFFKLKNEDLKYLHKKYSVDDRHVAKEVELFPNIHSSTRQIVIAPSKGKNGMYKSIYGDITNLDYIDIETIENFILNLIKILGEHKSKKTIIKKDDNKIIKVDIDEYYKKFKKELTDETKEKLLILKNIILDYGFIEEYLNHLNINYKVKKKTINLYSIITDDGEMPDAYIFKDTLVYYDFHNNGSYNFVYLSYMLWKDKVEEFINLYEDVKKEIEKNKIEDFHKNNIKPIDDIKEVKYEILDGRKLLIAGTGRGKTNTIKQLAKEGKKIIMLEPLTTQVSQEDKHIEYYMACFCENAKNNKITDNTTLIICTYDKFSEVIEQIKFDEWSLVVDEAHELICALSYRRKVVEFIWDVLKEREQFLLMTATNNLLFLNDYVDVAYKLKNKQKEKRKFHHIKTNSLIKQIIENVLNNYNKNLVQFVYIDSKNSLKTIYNNLLEMGVDYNDIAIVNSDNKIYDAKDIIENMTTNKKIYLSTRVLSAGFHIFSDKLYLYHIIPSDINVMIQETNRVRENGKNEVILFIYHSYKKKDVDINFEKEWNKIYITKMKFINKIKYRLEGIKDCKYDNKEYLEGNWYLLNATKNEFWVRFLVYNQIIPQSSKNLNYLSKVLKEEGFEECDIININSYIDLYSFDESTDFSDLFQEMLENDITISEKDNKTKKELYYIVNKIKKYKEVFNDEDLINYKMKIAEGKMSSVKRSISQKINLYAIENIDNVGIKTKIILDTKYEEVYKKLNDKNSITKNVVDKLIKDYNITRVEMSVILKKLNFKYDRKYKRYKRN